VTTATEPSPATERKQQAAVALQRLRAEREHMLTRQQAAENTIARLNQDIIQAQRSGDADALTSLRADRREAQESVQDLERALPGLDREIQLAEGELHMAERAVAAEQYNRIQVEQAQLLRTIEDAIHTIADALDQKERLAVRQQTLVTSVCPGHNHNAAQIRHDLTHVVTGRLQGNRGVSLRTMDWSTWPMSSQGDLLR